MPEGDTELAYLASRGLPGPYPEGLRRVPNARPGESALLMPLTAYGRITGILLTYLDALGRKSLVLPNRRRLDLERAPGAVMVIQEPAPGVIDLAATIVGAEGLENSLSIAHPAVARPGWRIIGLPGINALKNMSAKAGDRVIFFQDSDPDGSPARAGLQAGIDSLILQGASAVRCTEWNKAGDANAILQTQDLGTKALKRLLATPAGGALSFEGEVKRLADMPPTEYEKARRTIAKAHDVRVQHLDREVALRRPKPLEADEGSAGPSIGLPVDPPWTGPVPQLSQLLDRIVAEVRRYVVLHEWQAHLVAAWVALTYFVFDSRIDLQVMPRLAVQSAAISSGKTALLRIVCTLVRHGKLYGRATSAGIYRALSQAELTLCLDEVEFLRNDPYSPMMQVLDSSHHREDANILLTEPQKVGPPIARELSTWAAMVLACNGQLPGSLQSRSIVVVLQRALADEAHEFLEKRSTPELVGLRRELTAWAALIAELPFPSRGEMPPEIYNRAADNWRPMFAIGRLAGDAWLERIREASLKALQTETLPPLIVSLLASVKLAFGENPKPTTWLDTGELAARLIAQEGEPWGKVNRGGPIDPYWLRTKLISLLDPPGAQDWWQTVKGGKQKHRSGYFFNQFADAFRRFPEPPAGVFNPDDTLAETPPKQARVSGVSGEKPPTPKKTAIFDTPDGPGASGVDQVCPESSKSAADEPETPVTPDTPGDFAPFSVCVPDADEWGAETAPATVSLFITKAQRRGLRNLGYSDAQIREMLPADAHRLLGLGGADADDSAAAIIRQRLDERPGAFVLVTMVKGRPLYTFDDGAPLLGPAGKAISAAQFRRLGLVSVEGESLFPDGAPQRWVLRRPAPLADGAEQPSAVEADNPLENREAPPRPAARSRRAKPNGDSSAPNAGLPPALQPDRPAAPLPDYTEGSIAADVRALHAANPKRSIGWLAQHSGQPRSVIREILGDGEGTP